MNINSFTYWQREWDGVLRMRERIDHLVVTTFAFDPITSPLFSNVLYNLPLQLAVDVLKRVLIQMRVDEYLKSPEPQLLDLIDGAKNVLPWINWRYLREIAERQNELMHDGKLFGDEQCQQDIADIEAQLVAWGVITAAYVL